MIFVDVYMEKAILYIHCTMYMLFI